MSARIAIEAMWSVPRLRRTVQAALARAGRQADPADVGVGDGLR
jgi:hypothetical protein